MKLFLFLFPSLICHAASMTFSSSPSPLTVSKATSGGQPFTAIDSSTVCDLIIPPKKVVTILAALDSPLEPHTSLKIKISLPHEQTPSLLLSSNPQTLASSIPEGSYNSISVSYEYEATVAAGVIPPRTKTIFFTLLERD
jgi:hypothetical protein